MRRNTWPRPSEMAAVLILVGVVAAAIFAIAKDQTFRSDCRAVGGHYVGTGRYGALCVDSTGRIIGSK